MLLSLHLCWMWLGASPKDTLSWRFSTDFRKTGNSALEQECCSFRGSRVESRAGCPSVGRAANDSRWGGSTCAAFGVVWAMIPPASSPRGDEVIAQGLVLDLCWLRAPSFATLTTHRARDSACAVAVFTCPGQLSLAGIRFFHCPCPSKGN